MRKCWPIYRGQRLADILELETDMDINSERPADKERAAKRELYGQGALVMFKPFRTVDDLYTADDANWWNAYIRSKPKLEENPETIATLGNMQNFYESFCRSGKNAMEPDFANDVNLQRELRRDRPDDDANDVLDLLAADQQLESADASDGIQVPENPFVAKLATLSESLYQIIRSNQSGISVEEAKTAINQLPTKKKPGTFSLPVRNRVNADVIPSQESEQLSHQVHLDHVVGTRVELLSKIQEALLQVNYVPCPTDGTAPTQLEANFPTMNEQSKHWTLNKKQHLAFILVAAALLKHILDANRPDQTNLSLQMARMSDNIDLLLRAVLPASGQLIMFLGGSGGTGKSRVTQSFVDFARRWHSIASHVICASSGVAAILIGGCTLNTALGIAIDMHPLEPNNNHILAWSEIGILFLDELSMIKPSLYALTNSRLQKIKARLDKHFGGIHMVFSGDFYQLPPIGSYLYQTPTQRDNEKDKDANLSAVGRYLWRTQLTDVIELTENHRQTDKRYAAALERWRINQPTQEDINDANSRYVDELDLDVDYPPSSNHNRCSRK